MDDVTFQQARAAYASQDYEAALDGFTRCLQDYDSPRALGEVGLLYHQIGNCLLKLNNYNEAIQAYTQATTDVTYDAVGTVNHNLGMAYAALHDYEDAVRYFEIAVSDSRYDSAYKAYTSMGNALLKLGKTAEAGVAFRQAALDEANPDPTKALLNLGICFMALDRPSDAVATYESALQFDMPATIKNKLYANLGQAYVATGQMQKAVNAFEEALADKTYFLSDSANVDYQRAVGAVASGTAEMTAVMAPVSADMSGLDISADGTPVYPEDEYAYSDEQDIYYFDDSYDEYENNYAAVEDRFFNATDEELEQWSRGLAKLDRKRRNVGLKILVFFIALILALLATGVFLFTQGWGFPTQESVALQVFTDRESAITSAFTSDLSEEDIQLMLDSVVEDASATVMGENRSMSESTVYVSASTSEGADVTYEVSMVRSGIGWKISSIELYFASQN